MGTQLNIKSDDAYLLASQLAELTGESLTTAVTRALQERLGRERLVREDLARERRARVAELLEIGRRCAADLEPPFSSADHDDLYGDDGLPA